jgi:hypothetical protein
MEDQAPEERFKDAVTVPADHMNGAIWAMQRSIAIGGTSFSVAVALAITQLGVNGLARSIALFCACVAIPLWVTVWRIGENYTTVGASGLGHFSTLAGSAVVLLIFGVAGAFLVIAFASFIWSFSIISSVAFIVAGISGVGIIYVHQGSINEWVDKQSGNAT